MMYNFLDFKKKITLVFCRMMLPYLAFHFDPESVLRILVQRPALILLSASICITSLNEALWVASSFFTLTMLRSKVVDATQLWKSDLNMCNICVSFWKVYKVGQKLLALSMLSQVIAIGSVCSFVLILQLVSDLMHDQENRLISFCMLVPPLLFFVVIPRVQVPLWYGAYTRLLQTVRNTHEE